MTPFFTASFPFSHFKSNCDNDWLYVAIWIFFSFNNVFKVQFPYQIPYKLYICHSLDRGHSDTRQGQNQVSRQNQATRDGIRLKDLQTRDFWMHWHEGQDNLATQWTQTITRQVQRIREEQGNHKQQEKINWGQDETFNTKQGERWQLQRLHDTQQKFLSKFLFF